MSRVFLSFIGNHDPGEAEADENGKIKDGPAPSIVRHLCEKGMALDKAVLFYTPRDPREGVENPQPPLEKEYQGTRERLTSLCPGIEIEPVPLVNDEGIPVNPAREDHVLPVVLNWLNRGSLSAADEVHINCASGTPAMRSVSTFLVDAHLVSNASIWNSQDPTKPYTGDRIYPIGLRYLDEARHVHAAARLMKGVAFAEAADALTSIAKERVTTQRVDRAQIWQTLLKAYALWDRSFYRDAKTQIEQVLNDPVASQLPSTVYEVIRIQGRIVATLAKNERNPITSLPFLFDIYASLSRRMASQHFANVGTRTRRILEGTIRYAISQHRVLGVDAPETSQRYAAVRKSATQCVGKSGGMDTLIKSAQAHLRLYGSVSITPVDLGWGIQTDPFHFGTVHVELIEKLYEKIRGGLNKSVEVHGFESPDENDAARFMAVAQQCMSIACSGDESSNVNESGSLIFGADTVKYLAKQLEEWV